MWGNGRETANIFVSVVSGVVRFFKGRVTPHTGIDGAPGHALGAAWGGVVTGCRKMDARCRRFSLPAVAEKFL